MQFSMSRAPILDTNIVVNHVHLIVGTQNIQLSLQP